MARPMSAITHQSTTWGGSTTFQTWWLIEGQIRSTLQWPETTTASYFRLSLASQSWAAAMSTRYAGSREPSQFLLSTPTSTQPFLESRPLCATREGPTKHRCTSCPQLEFRFRLSDVDKHYLFTDFCSYNPKLNLVIRYLQHNGEFCYYLRKWIGLWFILN